MTIHTAVARMRRLAQERVIRNMSWLAMSYALSKPLWFVFITAVCMRLLPPEDYGIFTASLALAMLTSAIGDLGTGRYTTREVARRSHVANRLFSNILVGRFFLASSGFLIAILIGFALGYPAAHLWSVVGAGVYAVAFRGAEYCRAFFQAFEVLRYEGLLTIFEKVLVVTLGFAALYTFRTPASAFAGMAAGMVIALGLHVWLVHAKLARFSGRLLSSRFTIRTLWIALPIGLVGLLGAVPAGATPVIVEALLGSAPAGLYGAAQRIVEAMNLVTTILVVAVFPRFSSLHYGANKQALSRFLKFALAGGFLVSVGLATLVALFAPQIIMLLAASAAYSESASLLVIFALGYPFMSLTMITISALIAMNALAQAMLSMGTGAATSVVLALVLTAPLGMVGAVIAFVTGYVLTACLNLVHCGNALRRMADVPAHSA